MKEIEVIIIGRVQMVMYRDFAQRKARSLKLTGNVENLDNGAVNVVAQGDEETLKKYVELLNKGSILSNVESVSVVWREAQDKFMDFKIIH